jgi:hypothetical protein
VSAWVVGAALVAATGAIAALAAGEPRLGLVGLAASLIAAAVLADPLPAPALLGVRLAASLLAVAILRVALPHPAARGRPDAGTEVPEARSHLGWPSEVLFAAAAAAAGLAIVAVLPTFAPVAGDGTGAAGIGHSEGLGVAGLAFSLGLGLLTLALPALVGSGPGPRRAIAAVVATEAAILLRAGLIGPSDVAAEIALAAVLVGVGTAAAILLGAGRAMAEGASRHP